MGRDSVIAKNLIRKNYGKTTFDTILYITKNVTFPEDFREYQITEDIVKDQTVDSIQSQGILAFSQEPHATTIIVAKVTTDDAVDHLTEELARLDDILVSDYFMVCVDNDGFNNNQLIDLAKYIETQEYLGTFLTKEAGVKDALVTNDLASSLKALNLRHSSVWTHETESLDLAFSSRFLGEKIGLVNAKFLPLSGITTSNFTSTQRSVIESKNCNFYQKERKKYPMTKQGVTCSGESIRSVAGELWLNVRSIEAIYESLLNESNISFNSEDIEIVTNKVDIVCTQAQKQKIIAKHTPDQQSYVLTITPSRIDEELDIEIKYLDAGTLKWVTLTFIAYKDDNEFKLATKEA